MLNSLNPTHWFQFADDAAVTTGLEKENQILLNHFTHWCKWAGMKVRVDACVKFGIRKSATSLVQLIPKLSLNNSLVPTLERTNPLSILGTISILIRIIMATCLPFTAQVGI